ncbi:MAG TPA: biotin--[acetyl-CoA-carboxylase] ligase [Gemmatimonadaceae bacterium]|nr:biotin--[acetyl-CoA-carboxylase] ligase [Gemmatimonadaceae bacterium]
MLTSYDDVPCDELRARCGATKVAAFAQCSSTMDVAHALAAEGAPHGTIVVAEAQGAGRGRSGKAWTSAPRRGVWASVLLREPVVAPAGLLSLRTGITLARALDRHTPSAVRLKWPNDLFVGDAKLAGILTEARWRGETLEWLVVGVGVNVGAQSAEQGSASLPDARRADVLVDVVQSVLAAATAEGPLAPRELAEFAARDIAVGRHVTSPLEGVVLGIGDSGGVRIATRDGERVAVAGSLMFRTS